jgi:hypothetical protein
MKYYSKEQILLVGLYYQLNWLLRPYGSRNHTSAGSIGSKRLTQLRSEISTFVFEHSKVLTEETKRSLSNEMNLEDILDYLEEVNLKYNERMEQKNSETMELLSYFGVKESNAISLFLDTINSGEDSRMQMENKSCLIVIQETEAFIRSIVLENACGENIGNDLQWDYYELSKSNDGYLLELLCSDYVRGNDVLGRISFSNVSLKVQLFNYTLSCISRGNSVPWDYLGQCLSEIESKNNLGDEYINNKERKFLPLCRSELFMPSLFITGERDDSQTAPFIAYIEKSNSQILLPILDSILRSDTTKKRLKQILKFKNEIMKCEYEPLWRYIFEDLKEAASEYPSKPVLTCDQSLLTETRLHVTQKFIDAGFEGEYPNFRKMGSLGKIRVAEINGNPCFIGYEKHMASYVDCKEYCYDGNLTLYFFVGTILFKSDKLDSYDKKDAFSGFFHNGARRAGKVISAYIPGTLPESGAELEDLSEMVSIAIKRSMFQKLAKSERKSFYSYDPDNKSILTLSVIWTVGGLLYGLMLTASFMLIDLIVGLIDSSGSFSGAWDFLLQTPWWIFFAGSSFGFGILMFIISVIAQRK